MYIEQIVERLNNPYLKQVDNPGRMVLDGTIGEYLEHYNNHHYDYYISTAAGKYLDLHGQEYSLIRREDETDDSFRRRIIAHIRLLDTTLDFEELDVHLWTYDSGFNDGNVLVSRNTLIRDLSADYLFIAHADYPEDQEYLENMFLTGELLWE